MKNYVLKAKQITRKTFNLTDRTLKVSPDEVKRVLNAVISVHELMNERLEEILKKGGVRDAGKRK